jgi:death-on-curing family protein
MSSNKRISVRDLAQEANLDVDEVLLKLWDAEIEYVIGPEDTISGADLRRAKMHLNIPDKIELQSSAYWMTEFGMKDDEFTLFMEELGITVRGELKKLPKGSIKKLKNAAEKRNFIPISKEQFIDKKERKVKKIKDPQRLSEKCNQKNISENDTWQSIGHEKDIRHLNEKEVTGIHYALVEDFEKHEDPISPSGVRDSNLLNSALFRSQTSIGKENKYPTVELSGAALLYGLIHDHPFHNGNKRSALVSLLVFLDENGFVLECNQNDLFKFVLKVAQHKVSKDGSENPDSETMEIARWICQNSRQMEHGEKLIPFRKLRQILDGYKCIYEFGKSGAKFKIERRISKKGIFGGKKEEILKTQISYAGDGREVEVNTLKKIRQELKLSDTHGIDSKSFYDSAPLVFDAFISNYRKILKRLAKL